MAGESPLHQAHVANTASAKLANAAAQQPSYPGAPPAQEPSYGGAKSAKGKLEGTIGDIKLRFYGTLLLNVAVNDSVQIGQDVPLWPISGDLMIGFPDGTTRRAGIVRDTIFTARQTVLGFTVARAKSSESGWQPSGLLEFDFFGSRPVDGLQPQARVFNQPRLRLAYFQLENGMWRIVAGQDKVIIAPLDPISLSHVAIPLGATAGNLWGWLPQVRLDATHSLGDTSLLFQVGVLRPQFADPRLGPGTVTLAPGVTVGIPGELPTAGTAVDGAFSGFGERSNHPFYQARVAASHAFMGSTATVGLGAHYGRERIGAARKIDSWALAVDYHVPLHSRVILRGEGFVGSNLVPFQGGILQGVAATPAAPPFTKITKIGAGGGWAELTFRATEDNKNIFYAGAGTDDPRDRLLLPGTGRSKNSFIWASYFRKITNEVTVAFEWSNWDFQTRRFVGGVLGPRNTSGRGNVFNLALAYQF